MGWRVELVARIGWTSRDAWWAITQDPRVWAAVPQAGAVVFAVGGMDSLPSPLPTALREQLRYIRPPALRRVVRTGYQWLQPRLSKLGRPVALPPRLSVEYLESCRDALAAIRPDLPVIGTYPSVHRCDAYGRVHAGREPAVRALEAWSAQKGVPMVDLAAAVRDKRLLRPRQPGRYPLGLGRPRGGGRGDDRRDQERPTSVPSTESGAE